MRRLSTRNDDSGLKSHKSYRHIEPENGLSSHRDAMLKPSGAQGIWTYAAQVRGEPLPVLREPFLIRPEFVCGLHERGPIRGNGGAVRAESSHAEPARAKLVFDRDAVRAVLC